jgi:acyl-CoA thioester hydrolase
MKPKHERHAIAHNVAQTRVIYRDTDRMGHAYYANYLAWFEIGRNELLRTQGGCYRQWEEERGVFLPVQSCWVEYRKSAQYDDLLEIATWIVVLTKASITFEYEIRLDGSGDVLATGGTRHAFVARDGKVLRVADQLLPALFSKPMPR